jgi:hypothetical protein
MGVVATSLTSWRVLVGLEMHEHIDDTEIRIKEGAIDAMANGVALDDR